MVRHDPTSQKSAKVLAYILLHHTLLLLLFPYRPRLPVIRPIYGGPSAIIGPTKRARKSTGDIGEKNFPLSLALPFFLQSFHVRKEKRRKKPVLFPTVKACYTSSQYLDSFLKVASPFLTIFLLLFQGFSFSCSTLFLFLHSTEFFLFLISSFTHLTTP